MSVDLQRIRDRVNQKRASFDRNQNRAVDAILDEWNSEGNDTFIFPVVDGPPGTGKTSVGIIAVAEHLLSYRDEQIIYLCYGHFATEVARNMLFDLGFNRNQICRITPNPRDTDWERGLIGYDYFSNLPDETKRRLQNCGVLLCTLHGSRRAFDVRGCQAGARVASRSIRIIVDEFSQVTPPLWLACLQRAKDAELQPISYALLGDPYQLPVVTTQPFLLENVGEFIFRRRPDYTPHQLTVQHRMHEDICEAVNSLRRAFNTYTLQSSERVRHRDLMGLGFEWHRSECPTQAVTSTGILLPLREILDPSYPLVIVDTSELGRERRCFGGSLLNVDEAECAVRIATAFYESYTRNGRRLNPSEDFQILSPYTGQVGIIQESLPQELRSACTTIYRAQGREYPCVIISFVWNHPDGFIGFLREPELQPHTYVGCSRAQGKLIILLSRDCFIGRGHRDFDFLFQTRNAHIIRLGRA